MGRFIGDTSNTASTLLGEVVQLVDGGDVVIQNDGTYLKANGQEVLKTAYPDLYDFVGNEGKSYLDGSFVGVSNAWVTPPTVSEHIAVYNDMFYVFYDTTMTGTGNNATVAYSMSTDGVEWSYPKRIPVCGTFRQFRVLDNRLIVVGSARTMQFDGTYWTVLFNAEAYDVAFNGTTWIVCNNTTTLYKSTDRVTWTTLSVASATASIIWTGTQFFRVNASSTTAYKSTDGVTWTLVSLPDTSGAAGLKILQVNGNTFVSGSNYTFQYSSNLTTWSISNQTGANLILSCVYLSGAYYMPINTAYDRIGRYTTLTATPASEYSIGSASAPISIAYNPSNNVMFISQGSGTSKAMSKHAGAISTNVAGADIIPLWSTNGRIGDQYRVTYSAFGGAGVMTLMVEDKNNRGWFKHIKGTVSQGFIGITGDGSNFSHYAKDVGILYFANAAVYTTSKYTSVDFANGVCGSIFSTNISYGADSSNCLLHSNGWFYSTSTQNQSTAVIGTEYYQNTLGVACMVLSTKSFCSADGSLICTYGTATPYTTMISKNYGKSFTGVGANVYSSAGAVVALSEATHHLVPLRDKWYSYGGGYVGDTPYVLTATLGVPAHPATRISGVSEGVNVGGARLTTPIDNYVAIVTVTGLDGSSVHVTEKGTIVMQANNVWTEYSLPDASDTTKFNVPKLSADSVGTAKYIKGTK